MAIRGLREMFVALALVVSAGCSSAAVDVQDGAGAPATSPVTVADPASTTAAPAASSVIPATSTTITSTTMPASTTAAVALANGVFPAAVWAEAPLPDGVEEDELDAAVQAAFGEADNAQRVQSIVAVHEGRIVYERYHPLDSPDEVMVSYSVSKSFTSAVIGLLVGDGRLDVTEPAPVAAWADPDDPRHAITIENLLQMSSGLQWLEIYVPGSEPAAMFAAPVASDYAASLPLTAEPGTVWNYSTGTTAILAGIITDTLGGPEATDEYITTRLLDPLGITSTEFLRDAAGRWLGGIGANHTTRDFARFGLLFANDGVWDGTRILPEGWVTYSRTPATTSTQYGAQWWIMRPDAFEARGLFGQMIIVSPEHDLVIAINTKPGGDADSLAERVYDAFTRA